MEYRFRDIEKYWQQQWTKEKRYQVSNDASRPKYYVLDMFPYPSGAGLHVGHPLGYIASDIYARFKRLKGYNVLHPMGYDAFGLPAEQYAIEHGVHPAVSTAKNIDTFRSQLDNIGFSYDWSREIRTSDPKYYKWTQWIFLQLFDSWYNRKTNKTERISTLLEIFEKEGNEHYPIPNTQFQIPEYPDVTFTAAAWKSFPEKTRQVILMEYRVAYCGYGEVNWCEALGTVLANDEVVNGVSERGGYPVVKKKLRQWYLRITEYADRLLEGLQKVEFSDAMKEMQSNWIGKSSGAEVAFSLRENGIMNADASGRHPDIPALRDRRDKEQGTLNPEPIKVYTTRPDTIFGVDFLVLSPEHELVEEIITPEQKPKVEEYITYVKSRSERERMMEKKISGVFTGAYADHPITGLPIPIWISEYVLAGYGTGAIMAVPSGDERDLKFAHHFNIPVTNIFGDRFNGEEAIMDKDARLSNSEFLDGKNYKEAIDIIIDVLEKEGSGKRKKNYKIRDAAFSRQRYWGEPFPIQWKDEVAYPLSEKDLPLELPFVESYKPGAEGEGPLANIPEWTARDLETNTMPGYAGSSWYFLRYMDPHNEKEFCDKKISDYWGQVDLYVGGTEHAVGHLLYSRMWTKCLYDLGYINFDEPYRKLLNQGMIQGSSRFVYRVRGTQSYVSAGLKEQYETDELHVDVNLVDGVELDVEALRKWKPDFENAEFILEDGKYICGILVEKMSKRLYNTVNPDTIVEKFGADTFRMYEMFLGPVEMSKPWDTKGIEGVHRFLKKLWRLFVNENGLNLSDDEPTEEEYRVLHRTIKKIDEDTERFSFNTAVSAFMVCVNSLSDLKCNKKKILEPLVVLLAPYAPHVSEELYRKITQSDNSVLDAPFPVLEQKYLEESSKEYPISVNGKLRTQINIALDATQEDVQKIVLDNPVVQKWMEGKPLKKLIFVKGKMVNVVV